MLRHRISHVPYPLFSPVLGLVTSCLVSALWLSPFLKQPNVPHDVIGVALFALSAIIELLAEPLWVLSQTHSYVKLKVQCAEECLQILVLCLHLLPR